MKMYSGTFRKSVLVVDDSEDIRVLLRDILEERGYDVFEAANGKEALSKSQLLAFDVLITDLIMPEREGIETIRDLRALKPELKIIAMSGAVEACYLHAAKVLGADETLRKPFDAKTIVEAVDRLSGIDG
jgi:CheY-like chemotaxis protein